MEKTFYVVDEDFKQAVLSRLNVLDKSLENLKAIKPPERYTADEFMAATKMSRWKFDILVRNGLLKTQKIGKRFFIEPSEVERYWAGEIQLK